MNESLADVFGALTVQYKLGQKACDATWTMGEGQEDLFGALGPLEARCESLEGKRTELEGKIERMKGIVQQTREELSLTKEDLMSKLMQRAELVA